MTNARTQRRRPRPRGRRVHGEVQGEPRSAFEEVSALVRQIPPGRIMTYGQISGLLLSRLSPVAVGWALHRCDEGVPWHRVVNASGGCSTDRIGAFPPGYQRSLLEREGVQFRADGTLDLDRYRYASAPPAAFRRAGRSPSTPRGG